MTVPDEGPHTSADWRGASDAVLARGMQLDASESDSSAAWREFDRRHLPHVKAFISARAADLDADVRDDLAVELVLRVQTGIAKYTDRGNSLRSWCFKIADRVILDFRRGRPVFGLRQAPAAVELVSFAEVEELLAAAPHDDDGDDDYPPAETRHGNPAVLSDGELAMQAFDSLNEIDRAILWGTLMNRDSDEYLAEVTGKPVDHIRKIRYKAIEKLRKAFDRLARGARRAS